MSMTRTAVPFLVLLLAPATSPRAWASAGAAAYQASGTSIDLSVERDGASAPLYRARDGSGRYYLEARAGGGYALRIVNRSSERVGIVVAVDGLNAISGEREPVPSAGARPGRMYVVDPWDEVRVRGWRTSLEDVRQFTFVDEHASYAARTGRANGRMGWIEAWVYRERSGPHITRRTPPIDRGAEPESRTEERARDDARPAPGSERPPDAEAAPRAAAPPSEKSGAATGQADSFPGTGWGSRAYDPAQVVTFNPDVRPFDSVTVRYEYAPALRALGILPPDRCCGRLGERERGDGFARPPAW
jgi:hypothetical protein